ncbi:hypothetical protein TNCV_3566841 [Trichonephila clavipes]|nr:hypothetical protein TNCV_3566841 [Trichonephila clavipes]
MPRLLKRQRYPIRLRQMKKSTQIICPPLRLLQPVPKSSSILAVSSIQANLLASTSSAAANQPTVPLINTTTVKSNSRTSAVSKATNNLKQSRKN